MEESSGFHDRNALLGEGLGTAYEHLARRQYLRNLVRRLNIRVVLEASDTGVADSASLADMGCEIVLMNNSKQNLRNCSSRQIQFLKGDLRKLPLNSNIFDLVWNSDAISHSENTLECIREMVRVSKRFVLVFVPNRLHVGDLFFRLYLRIAGSRFKRKYGYSMTLKTLSKIFREADLTIVAQGGIDMPLWPSHISVGKLIRKCKRVWNFNKSNLFKFLHVQGVLEESLPEAVKAAQAHMIYVLGKKGLDPRKPIQPSNMHASNKESKVTQNTTIIR